MNQLGHGIRNYAARRYHVRFTMKRSLFATFLAVLGTPMTSCAESTAPRPATPGFTVVSTPADRDTIHAQLDRPLIVELRDELGELQRGVEVVARVDRMYFAESGAFQKVMQTDERGRVQLDLWFGPWAGPAWTILTAASLATVDTIEFLILPGQASRLDLGPRNRWLSLGDGLQLSPRVRDRHGNSTLHRPNLSAGEGLQISDSWWVTGLELGDWLVEGRGAGFTDIATISVLPPARRANYAFNWTGIGGYNIYATDANGRASLSFFHGDSIAGHLHWSADGEAILFSGRKVRGDPMSLMEVGYPPPLQSGSPPAPGPLRTIWSPPAGSHAAWPSLSRSDGWIYFILTETGASGGGIWRVRPDGTDALEVIASAGSGWVSPSPSPDGSQLAFVGAAGGLYIASPASPQHLALRSADLFTSVQWSPTDPRLLVCGPSGLSVLDLTSGSETLLTEVLPGSPCITGWSPDGEWAVGNGNHPIPFTSPPRGEARIFHVTSGMVLTPPLRGGWISNWRSP